MTSLPIKSIDTKLEAYKLIHDSTRLFSLLYSKYGEIQEDFFISFINQLMYNIPSKYNRIYKESLYTCNIQEFLRRYYRKKESKDRLPKLSDYYKNYLIFFCRPFFKQLELGKIVHNFQDKQAEIFYKNNYSETLDYEREKDKRNKENSYKKSSDELSSLDNITSNKIIFDDKTKKIIDNEFYTLTLESPRNNKNDFICEGELISKRSNANNSFEKVIHYLVNSQFKKKIENKIKKTQKVSQKKLINSPSAHHPYLTKIIKNNYYNINSLNMEIIPKTKKIKNSLYTLAKNNFIKSRGFSNHNISKDFLSPKINKININLNAHSNIHSKIEDAKNFKYNSHIHSFQNFFKNNKNNYSNFNKISKNNKIIKVKNSTRFNTNTIYKNFSNLSETLNRQKQYSSKNTNTTSYKNNFNLSKSKKANYTNSSNLLIKSINKIENIKKTKNFVAPKNSNFNNKMNKLSFQHSKNKTFDFNSLQNDNLTKFNNNNNFSNFRAIYNKNNQTKKKICSKFNLIKKPNTEIHRYINSPSQQLIDNKIEKDKSLSHNTNKTKKIFFSLYQNNKSNNIKTNKFYSPKILYVSKKNITYCSDENNKEKNSRIEKTFKNYNNYKENIKSSKNKNNKAKSKESIYNWKIKNSPLKKDISKYNQFSKNKKNASFNNTMKIDNFTFPKKDRIKSIKKNKNNKINNNRENFNNIFNNSNRINNKFLEMIGDNLIFSRNKKQSAPKISSTRSQNEINLKDISIKHIKNLKFNANGNKKNMFNRTFLNKNQKNIKINYNFKPINSSSEIQNIHKNNILSKLNLKKIAIKRKQKRFSQRMNLKNIKKRIYAEQRDNINTNKINVIFNGDVIINKNQLIEIKQNNSNNKNINKDVSNKNKNVVSPIDKVNKGKEKSPKIINVNRNINLINKKEQNQNI